MAKELQLSIDLGCESAKVCYAYKSGRGDIKYGLIKVDDHPYPASVSYCREEKRWLIGAGIAQLNEFAYDTIVRIKDLVSMVIPTENSHGELVDNSYYYDNEKHFRRFYFPRKVKGSTSMAKAIENDQTFTSDITPKELCKLFFERLFKDCIAHILFVSQNIVNSCYVPYRVTVSSRYAFFVKDGSNHLFAFSL